MTESIESSPRTALSIIAQLTRESCSYHADSFSTPDFSPDLIARDEPYISDSTIDEMTASLDAITILTNLIDTAMLADPTETILDRFLAALRAHTILADIDDDIKPIIPDATYPADECICYIIPFQTELITPCPHNE